MFFLADEVVKIQLIFLNYCKLNPRYYATHQHVVDYYHLLLVLSNLHEQFNLLL